MRPSKRTRSGTTKNIDSDGHEDPKSRADDAFGFESDADDGGAGAAAVRRAVKRDAERAARRRRTPSRAAVAAATAAYHSSDSESDDNNNTAGQVSSQNKKKTTKKLTKKIKVQKTPASDAIEKKENDDSDDDDDVHSIEGLSDLDDDEDDFEIDPEDGNLSQKGDDGDESETETEDPKAASGYRTAKFASTLSQLLAPLPAAKNSETVASRPILSKKRSIESKIDDAKLEARARRVITAEKKRREDIGHVIPDHTTMDYEKKLRKLATRGVVQLFNAIRAAQKDAKELQSDGIQKHSAEASTVTKQTFIKTLKEEAEKKSAQPKSTSSETNTVATGLKPDASATSVAKKTASSTAQAHEKKTANVAGSAQSNETTQDGGATASAVSWMASDYGMAAPKHWDQDDGDDENVEF